MSEGYYGDTSGWSGSETSRSRAEHEDATGITGRRSAQVYALVTQAGWTGMTDREVQGALKIGHGASSGALTRLHRTGKILRLQQERLGNQVYVLPQFVGERQQSPYRPQGAAKAEPKPDTSTKEAADYIWGLLQKQAPILKQVGPDVEIQWVGGQGNTFLVVDKTTRQVQSTHSGASPAVALNSALDIVLRRALMHLHDILEGRIPDSWL